MITSTSVCPCGSGLTFSNCCQAFISGSTIPATPLQLMRSRYTAYTQANISYIAATMRGVAAKNFNPQQAEDWAKNVAWQKLEIIQAPLALKDTGFVEFKAYYQADNQWQLIHETSKFKKIAHRWYYISGHTHSAK